VLHLQEIVGGPLDVFADLVTVRRSIQKCSKDEHVQRALQQIRALLCLVLHHRRHSTLDMPVMVGVRPSTVNGELKYVTSGPAKALRGSNDSREKEADT
jgi:hypothetical protein